MKLKMLAAAITVAAIGMPAFAQDKPPADAPKAQTQPKGKPHSHLEDRQGITPSDQPRKIKVVDKSKHFHPRDR